MRLPVLFIPEPCPERWERLVGDERSRHCEKCDKSVVNLTALTDAEAADALRGRDLCVRAVTEGGAVVTRTTRRRELADALGALAAAKRARS